MRGANGSSAGCAPLADDPQGVMPAGVAEAGDVGWGNYFRYGNSSREFSAIDSYVRLRLAQLASVKHGRPGRAQT